MNHSDTLTDLTNITRFIPPLVGLLFIVLSTVWTTLLLGKGFIVYFHPEAEFVWFSRRIKYKKINFILAKLILLLVILIFASLTASFKTAQQFISIRKLNIASDNCSGNYAIDYIEITHLCDGLSQLCLLTMFSFINIATIFLQIVFSSSQDFRLIRILTFVTLTLKIIIILPLTIRKGSFIWIQASVIIFIYMEYVWLVVNARRLYRTIKAKIVKFQDSCTRLEQRGWEQKRLGHLCMYSLLLFGCSFLLVVLPLNWAQITLDLITAPCNSMDILVTTKFTTTQLRQTSKILNITENLLHIPLLLMVIVYFGLTGFMLVSYLERYCRHVRENSALNDPLIQRE